MARGFHRGGLIAWETTKQAGDRAKIAGCEVVFPECMGSVGEADLDPHLVPGFAPAHLLATMVAQALDHQQGSGRIRIMANKHSNYPMAKTKNESGPSTGATITPEPPGLG